LEEEEEKERINGREREINTKTIIRGIFLFYRGKLLGCSSYLSGRLWCACSISQGSPFYFCNFSFTDEEEKKKKKTLLGGCCLFVARGVQCTPQSPALPEDHKSKYMTSDSLLSEGKNCLKKNGRGLIERRPHSSFSLSHPSTHSSLLLLNTPKSV